MPLKLIIGLRNPGAEYEQTRHNAGAWFIDALLQDYAGTTKEEKKLQGTLSSIQIQQLPCLTFTPASYMNLSGLSVRRITDYFKLTPADILIVHDDLDLPVGTIKLKADGGHGGHNGLRDIIQHLGTAAFHRLRIGIGHPGQREEVHHYVLNAPSKHDRLMINTAIEHSMVFLPFALQGEWSKAMQILHTSPNKDQ
ncbi:MAG: aminoacyl-tRNA hydrolase [Gammaproteobacteria bacterium]|nr:aminoacyl-tRNA hydrolase [Gammaproteobacteria bacterium]